MFRREDPCFFRLIVGRGVGFSVLVPVGKKVGQPSPQGGGGKGPELSPVEASPKEERA